MANWMSTFNGILYEQRDGLQFCDLPDEDQSRITEMVEDFGFTPAEAFDVLSEVNDVE